MEKLQQSNTTEASKARKASSYSVFNFAEAEIPIAKEKPNKGWVDYGLENLYPQELIEAWQMSPTHNALVNGISQMIAGESIIPIQGSDPTEVIKFEIFAQKVNKNYDTLQDIVNKIAFDLYLHGYFCIETIYNVARTKISEIYHVPAETIRSGIMNDDNEITTYYFSREWENYMRPKFRPKKIPAFDPTQRAEGRQLMFTKQWRPSQYYYSTPDYIGALNWIFCEWEVSNFHLNNLENGFFPSALIQFFNGEPPQKEKDAIENKFRTKFAGSKGKKLVFSWNNTRDQAVQIDTFQPNRLDQFFKELMPQITEKIMVGHRVVSPMLFGIKDQTGWGNNADEIQNASILFNKVVIMPYQMIILRTLHHLFKYTDFNVDLTIKTLQPIQFLDDSPADASASMSRTRKFKKHILRNQNLDKKELISDEMKPKVIKHLQKKGKPLKSYEDDGYVLVQIDDKLTPAGEKLVKESKKKKFASNISSEPEAPSALDSGLYKVRYDYGGPHDEKNRDFCDEVLNIDLIYRYEDINKMTVDGANPEFGYYNIFDFKGSYNCRHWWRRLTFFRKRNTKGQFLPADGLLNDKLVSGKPPFFPFDDSQATSVNEKVQR